MQDSVEQYTETIRPLSRKGAKENFYVTWVFILTLFSTVSFLQGIYNDPRWLSLTIAGLSGLWMLINRMRTHDAMMFVKRVYTPIEEIEEMIGQEIRPYSLQGSGNVIKYGRYSFPREKWQTLAKSFANNDYKFIRRVVNVKHGEQSIFPNITENWPNIEKEFKRLGWADGKKLTLEGQMFFNQFLL